ncbi:NMP1A-like protein [Mya arenaria]|uniref:NMP1A-like protein n=1 Tax=Mya arenaria TaxID=6604 RepID=A0ABY7E5B8_MYAAR|nr:NMP1A-like protein [Mya arenaria]
MFNYQSEIFLNLLHKWQHANISKEDFYRKIGEFSRGLHSTINNTRNTIKLHVPKFVQESPVVQEVYSDWLKYYDEAYAWIHPKFHHFSNTMLHYGSGVSIGVLASLLILVFILSKILPGRLKNLIYFMFFLSASASVYFINQFANYMSNPITGTLAENWQYIVGYILLSGLISFALVYRYGPVENERTMSLIQWFLQGVGLALVYNSTQLTEVSCALVIILLAVYNFPTVVFTNQRTKNIWFRIFPPKVKLLTEDEYVRQGNESTQAELAKLRDYCRSPDCQAWKVISRLKNPHRFAEFVEGNSWHVNDEELLEYDSGPDPTPPHLADDNDIEEMDFQLSSP